MKHIGNTLAAGTMALLAGMAQANEPGVPPAFPTQPVLTPGHSLTYGYIGVRGPSVDGNGDDVGQDFSVDDFIVQYTYNSGMPMLGGTYRFAARANYASVTTSSDIPVLDQGNNKSIGDISITPIDIVWTPSPGVFYSAGLTFGFPTGDYVLAPGAPSVGNNVPTAALQVTATKATPDYVLTGFAHYVTHGRNDSTGYKSGDQLTLLGGMLFNVGNGISVGPLGAYTTNVTDDDNRDGAFGGATFEVEKRGLGVGYVQQFASGNVLSGSYLFGVGAENQSDSDSFQISLTVPFGNSR